MPIYGPWLAKVVEVHDGDTIYMDLDLGLGVIFACRDLRGKLTMACRVVGINAKELSTEEGKQATEFAKQWLPVGTLVVVQSRGWDKYGGRFDGEITLPDGHDFGTLMVSTLHASPVHWKNAWAEHFLPLTVKGTTTSTDASPQSRSGSSDSPSTG